MSNVNLNCFVSERKGRRGPAFYKREPRRALRGMAKLDLERRGFYQTIQDMIYDHGGPIVDDERFLAGQMMISLRKYRALRDELLAAGRIVRSDDGRLFDDACAETLEAYHASHVERAESGRKGGVKTAARRQKIEAPEEASEAVVSEKRAENELKTIRKPSGFEGAPAKNKHLAVAEPPKNLRREEEEEVVVVDARARPPDIAAETSNFVPAPVWLQRLAAVKLKFGPILDASPNANTAKFFRDLCEPHCGEPCDWERDVVPAIEAVLGSYLARGETVSSFGVIVKAALRNRDRRLAGAPEIDPKNLQGDRHGHASQPAAQRRGTASFAGAGQWLLNRSRPPGPVAECELLEGEVLPQIAAGAGR